MLPRWIGPAPRRRWRESTSTTTSAASTPAGTSVSTSSSSTAASTPSFSGAARHASYSAEPQHRTTGGGGGGGGTKATAAAVNARGGSQSGGEHAVPRSGGSSGGSNDASGGTRAAAERRQLEALRRRTRTDAPSVEPDRAVPSWSRPRAIGPRPVWRYRGRAIQITAVVIVGVIAAPRCMPAVREPGARFSITVAKPLMRVIIAVKTWSASLTIC